MMDELLKSILEEDSFESYFDLDNLDSVLEATGVNYSDGTVIYGYFPYEHPEIKEYDKTKTTFHYGVVINHPEYGAIVPMCTSINPNTIKRTLSYLSSQKLNYVIPNETSKGFKKPTAVKAMKILRLARVEHCTVKGLVDVTDIKEIRARVDMFFRLRLKMIEVLQNYMKMEPFTLTQKDSNGATVNNNFQTAKDMLMSHAANSLDVCTMVRHVCKAVGLKHHIVWVRLLDKSKWTIYDHFYVVYLPKKNPKEKFPWRAFRFFYIGKNVVGSTESVDLSLDVTLKHEEKFIVPYLTPYHSGIVSGKTVLLDEDDLKKWDHFVAMKSPQKKMMDYLDEKYPGNLRKKDS